MFDVPYCFWQTHCWMTVSNLKSTELRSGLLGGHVWCEVRSLVSQQLSVLAHAWCAASKSRQQLDRCLAATVWAARHHSNMHHSLSPMAARKPHQCISAWRHRLKRHVGTCLSDTSEGRQWAEAASDWNMVSNQQRFIDQAIEAVSRGGRWGRSPLISHEERNNKIQKVRKIKTNYNIILFQIVKIRLYDTIAAWIWPYDADVVTLPLANRLQSKQVDIASALSRTHATKVIEILKAMRSPAEDGFRKVFFLTHRHWHQNHWRIYHIGLLGPCPPHLTCEKSMQC